MFSWINLHPFKRRVFQSTFTRGLNVQDPTLASPPSVISITMEVKRPPSTLAVLFWGLWRQSMYEKLHNNYDWIQVIKNNFLFQVQQITKMRYGSFGNYREIMSYPPVEWCSVMRDSFVNPIYKLAVQAVSNSVPALFHVCPYIVRQIRISTRFNVIWHFHFRDLWRHTTWPSTWTKYSRYFPLVIIPTLFWFSTTLISKFSR